MAILDSVTISKNLPSIVFESNPDENLSNDITRIRVKSAHILYTTLLSSLLLHNIVYLTTKRSLTLTIGSRVFTLPDRDLAENRPEIPKNRY